MAYGTKYYLEHFSNRGIPYYVQLQKEDYAGDQYKLKFNDNGLVIDYNLKAWEESIMTLVVKMSILNDASNWYAYEDLFTLEDKEFKLIIDASYSGENKRIFDGWVNSSPVQQKYLHNSTINITGSNFIQKMGALSPAILYSGDASSGDAVSLIDLINDSLKLTGKEDNIYVNCRLEPSIGPITNTTTLFNKAALNPTLFFKDNQNKASGLEIIESILQPLNCYLYWWAGDWYIERYRDLFPANYQKKYVRYSYDVSYGFDTNGTYSLTTDASHILPLEQEDGSMIFVGSSQKITMIPGIKYLELDLEESYTPNLTTNDFRNIGWHYQPSLQYPTKLKGWCASRFIFTGTPGYDYPGFNTDISNTEVSLGYSFTEVYPLRYPSAPPASTPQHNYKVGPGNSVFGIQNAIYRFGAPKYWYNFGASAKWEPTYAGISTRIAYTINSTDTKLRVQWKFKPDHINECTSNETLHNVRDYDYKCHYMIRPLESGIGGAIWITYNEEDDYWYKHTSGDFNTYANYVIVNGADLNDQGWAEVSAEIPIGDVSGYITSGDGAMIFIIGMEKIKKSIDTDFRSWTFADMYGTGYICDSPIASQLPQFCFSAYYGDVYITGDPGGDKAHNKIIAQINTNVLNIEKVTFSMYDASSLFLDNGIRSGGLPYNRYGERTAKWNEEDASVSISLVEWYIHDRFQLYSTNRREIQGTILYPGYLKPMSMWYDEYDPTPKKYILSSYSYNVGKDIYDCTWMEYDNTTQINLGQPARREAGIIDPALPASRRTVERTTRTGTTPTRRDTPPTTTRTTTDRRR